MVSEQEPQFHDVAWPRVAGVHRPLQNANDESSANEGEAWLEASFCSAAPVAARFHMRLMRFTFRTSMSL